MRKQRGSPQKDKIVYPRFTIMCYNPSLPVSEKLKVKKPNDSTRKRNNLKKSGRNLKLSLAFLLDLWYNCFVGI